MFLELNLLSLVTTGHTGASNANKFQYQDPGTQQSQTENILSFKNHRISIDKSALDKTRKLIL